MSGYLRAGTSERLSGISKKRNLHFSAVPLFVITFFVFPLNRIDASDAYEAAAVASHKRMIAELDKIEAETAENNVYLGDSLLRKARQVLNGLPSDASPIQRGVVLGYVGWYELCYGLESEAIATLEKARKVFPVNSGTRKHPELMKIEGSLALAYLRKAETQNCCAKPNPDSCIFPIRGDAIHQRKEGAEKAFALLADAIPVRELDEIVQFEEKWLLNLALMVQGKGTDEIPSEWSLPEKYLNPDPSDFPQFKNTAATAGVDTFGLAGGAVADDFDGDGFTDLLVSDWDPSKSMKFFRGKGDGTFTDQTPFSNLQGIRGGLNIKQGDFDNDGDIDAYVMRGAWMGKHGKHPNSLLRNNGVGPDGHVTFTDVTFAVGLGQTAIPGQTGDWADFDLDGDLDLFVGGETVTERFPCLLYRNDGPDHNGIPHFTEIGKQAGIETFRYVKGMSWGDYDGDRFPDIYLSVLHGENHLLRNMGNGTFRDVTSETGTAQPAESFPTWFWDYNNDGLLDLFVSEYTGFGGRIFQNARPTPTFQPRLCRLYQYDGSGGFQRMEEAAGLVMPMLPMGSNFGDLTNDGYPDIYLGTGDPRFSSIVPNILLSNEDGKFKDRTVSSRLGHLQKGHAVSFADFDRDGDLDIFEQMGGAYRCDPYYDALYRNPGTTNHWISIRLRGRQSNRFGVGSRIRVVVSENNQERSLYQWMNSGGSFGANPLELHFGLGTAKKISRIEVFWPVTGKTQVVKEIDPESWIEIDENGDTRHISFR